ncbi:DUF2778 domain-containing protein [Enterobacter cancerogenus]|uniref:DUF2778 domain-containing protein n=1 Tax=Enterobacter cancerogenus TaxID=69218 RepID=UPI00092F9D22|nr:DUF2778 domain-containing protein [Enterobacter cancerogenus]MDT7010355.1 DUF2778 domain-containing protein [Enterobacter cancerogenus]MRG34341.1 DUF2778 domain-containing protein [Enterobacter cancerogenus]QZY36729.1 DUF2778 domain-containing protein [Enterobacter cancerogenus]WNN56675.1 DUF2778 domain-containing protein [Enterobacter cancerogenus]HDR2628040.1 DUF2778 domain-containing protein [Enterobacter cancerogenus]
MALHGTFQINDSDFSPLIFPGIGTFLAFSGDGIYRNRGACGMKPRVGPIPEGKYWIVDRPTGGIKSQMVSGLKDAWNQYKSNATFTHNEWFALWRDDWGIDDYTWIENVKRGNFRLHPGSLSEGCITLPHGTDFATLRNALLRTPKLTVPCMKSLTAYGTIEVIAYGKKCP